MTDEEIASQIIENARLQAEQTRLIAASEAAQIIENALKQADEIKRNALASAEELKQD